MIRKYFLFGTILLLFLITSACSTSDKKTTISIASDTKYVDTFDDLNLGILFDFDFTLTHADKRWVTLWVESYRGGEKDEDPLTVLSYGNSPDEMDEGHLGFGMIDPNSDKMSVFLYGPTSSLSPSLVEEPFEVAGSTWDYAIDDDDEVQLELGETKLLAAYKGTYGNSIGSIDLQDEKSVEKMIKQDDIVLLLKIKVEEKDEDDL